MAQTTYGYVLISTKDQNEDRQFLALKEFGVKEKHIYMDKLSGKDFNRPEYRKMIRKLQPEDILVLKAINRPDRDYEEILQQWRIITKEIQADIVVLDMPLLDTRQIEDNLTGTFISDLVFQILSYMAQLCRIWFLCSKCI